MREGWAGNDEWGAARLATRCLDEVLQFMATRWMDGDGWMDGRRGVEAAGWMDELGSWGLCHTCTVVMCRLLSDLLDIQH